MFRVVISVEEGVLLKKVVYFDENSATDYLVVKNGGALVLNDFEEEKSGSSAEIHVGAKLKLLFNSLFVSGVAKVESNIGLYTSGENLIKTTITNTTLSDFTSCPRKIEFGEINHSLNALIPIWKWKGPYTTFFDKKFQKFANCCSSLFLCVENSCFMPLKKEKAGKQLFQVTSRLRP